MLKERTQTLYKKIYELEEYSLFIAKIFAGIKKAGKYKKDILSEMLLIGVDSVPIVIWGGLFVGIILTLETGYRFSSFGAKTLVGRTVALGMVRELAPIITGLLLAARTGAKNSSELGAMKISEQVEALRAFGTNPIDKLVVPRVIASVIMFFPLVAIANFVGIIGGMFIAKTSLLLDPVYFWNAAITGLRFKDLLVGFVKPFFFGFFISSVSCYYGLNTQGGTTGLGKNTIKAVVMSCFSILVTDLILTKVVWELL